MLLTPKNSDNKNLGRDLMTTSKFYMGYSRWDATKGRYETWDEAVDRVLDMHKKKYEHLDYGKTIKLMNLLTEAGDAYKSQLVLGAQRALQFGGEQILKHEARMYNCASSWVDRTTFFQECIYLLLCGSGTGFSVERRYINKLPTISRPDPTIVRPFQVPDCIEGWADAFGVLLSCYFDDKGSFPNYKGGKVHFDFSKIRPKGSPISGGFLAPGSEGLRLALARCEAVLDAILDSGANKLRSIDAYDFVMHMADAVLAGGVRRSATLCMFDKDDQDMLNAKSGNWFATNPQRARSNNSAVLKRSELTRDEWANIIAQVKGQSESGFVFVDEYGITYNPCVEIGMVPVTEDGESGFQFCNLVELNGSRCTSKEEFYKACRAGAILATLQAGYTNFKYLSGATKKITEKEALIGVSITGWMNSPDVLFDELTLKQGAEIVKEVNREVAALIGINPAARTTCVKPSGNASVLLGTASGIHGEHAPYYLRNIQMNKMDSASEILAKANPSMVEDSVWSTNKTDIVMSFPIVSKEESIYKRDLLGVKQLEFVKKAQQWWVEPGTTQSLCTLPSVRHNVSNTITVDNWDEVEQFLFDNRQWFAGVSLIPEAGEKAYAQAPFTEVYPVTALIETYGTAIVFASGLLVDGITAFGNLWIACDSAMGKGKDLPEDSSTLLKRDWVRRFRKFAANYFGSDLEHTASCLKDCYNLHRWEGIMRTMKDVDFNEGQTERLIDADTLASQACAGGVCDLN